MLTLKRTKLRILLVDDHELTRVSLSLALRYQEDIELVGVAGNGQEAIDLVRQYCPDVVILDLQMPVMDGLSASTHIKAIHPAVQILAYSSLEDPQTEVIVQTGRIDAFCSKETSTSELIDVVRDLGQRGES